MTQRILLVDDDASLRKLFGFVLRRQGYEVEEAENGLEGLAKLDGADFDLMVVDVMMPMLDGVRFLSIVREERLLKTPILVLTSMDRASADAEIRAAGATEMALKPIPHKDLLERVQRLLASAGGN
ncbi:MAG TPA: response regulator [Pseudomonadales bacterium]|nr:response regulator [Pseudomonadales bacterium]